MDPVNLVNVELPVFGLRDPDDRGYFGVYGGRFVPETLVVARKQPAGRRRCSGPSIAQLGSDRLLVAYPRMTSCRSADSVSPTFARCFLLDSRRAFGSLAPFCARIDLDSFLTCLSNIPPEKVAGSRAMKNWPQSIALPSLSVNDPISVPRSAPDMAAHMTAALRLAGTEKVLEVGTGSGYQTAVLAELSFNVFSAEKIRALATHARAVLDRLQYHNIAIQVGDGTIGWPEHAPFDAIMVTAGAPDLPRPLLEQLAPGGRLVIPVGVEKSQVLIKVTRAASGFKEEQLGDCRFVKLWGKFGWQE